MRSDFSSTYCSHTLLYIRIVSSVSYPINMYLVSRHIFLLLIALIITSVVSLLSVADGKNCTQKTSSVADRGAITDQSYPWRLLYVQSFPSILAPEILPPSDSELCPRRSRGVRLAYTDPSGERQRAPSTPQQWGPPSLHRSFRRATASTVHSAAVGSA